MLTVLAKYHWTLFLNLEMKLLRWIESLLWWNSSFCYSLHFNFSDLKLMG